MAELSATFPTRPTHPTDRAAAVLIGLVGLRIIAGVIENFGVPRLSEAAAMALLAGLVLHFFRTLHLARATAPLVAGLLAWILAAGISAAAAPMADPLKAWSLASVLLLYALFANALWSAVSAEAGLRLLGRLLTGFVMLGIALSVAQILSGQGFVDPGKPDVMRAFGSDVHPVSFGLQLVLALTGLAIIRLKRGQGVRWGSAALILFALAALYLTFARTAWGLMALIILWVAIGSGPAHRRAVSAVLVLAGALFAATHSARFDDLATLPEFLRGFSFAAPVFDYRAVDNSFSWRIVNWAFGLQYAMDALLTGYGPGQSAQVSMFGLEMHNILLEALFELGVPGLAAILLVLMGFARLHRALPRDTRTDQQARQLANGAGAGLLLAALFSTSMVDQLMTILIYLIVLRATAIPACTSRLPSEIRHERVISYPKADPKGTHERESNAPKPDRYGHDRRLAAGAGPAQSGHGTGHGLGHVGTRQSVGNRTPRGDPAWTALGEERLSGSMAGPRHHMH